MVTVNTTVVFVKTTVAHSSTTLFELAPVGNALSTVDERKAWLEGVLERNRASGAGAATQAQMLRGMADADGATEKTIERSFKRWRAGERLPPKHVQVMAEVLEVPEADIPNTPTEQESLLQRLAELEAAVRGLEAAVSRSNRQVSKRLDALEKQQRATSGSEGRQTGN